MISLTDDLAPVWRELGEEERQVVLLVATRLRAGQDVYGVLALERDARDMTGEASEELVDAAIYLAIETLRRRRAAG